MVKTFYTTCISVDIAHYEKFYTKVGTGSIMYNIHYILVAI